MSRRTRLLAASMLFVFASGCATVDLAVSMSGPAEKQPVASATTTAGPAESGKSELAKIHSHWAYFNTRNSPAILKKITAPKAEAVFCGTLRGVAGGDRTCCLTRATKDGAWESLVIDFNGNNDLTDDAVLTLPAPGAERTVTIDHGGKDHEFVLSVQPSRRGWTRLSLSPTSGRWGTAHVDGVAVKWAVADCNLSGKTDAGDTVYLDLDGDGRIGLRKGDRAVVLKPQSAVCLKGRWYGVAPDSVGAGIDIEPYTGEMHTLVLDSSKVVENPSALSEMMLTYVDGKAAKLTQVDASAGVKLPAGRIRYLSGVLPTSPKPMRFYKYNLQMDKDVTLALAPPAAQLSVQQKDGKILVSQRIAAPEGVRYSLARGKPGPLVEVFRSDDLTTPVAKGNMAYG